MAYRRRRYPPRRRYRRRRFYRRRKRGGRIGRQLRTRGSNNFLIKQKVVSEFELTAATAYPDIEVIQFKLDDLPQVTTLTRLFDNYKINFVVYELRLVQVGDAQSSLTGINCQVALARDYDGDLGPTTWNQLLERSDTRLYNIQSNTTRNMAKRMLVPKVQNTVFNAGGVSTGSSLPRSKLWVDSGNPSVPHLGLILGINPYGASPSPGTVPNLKFLVTTTYYLSFKNTI